MKWLALVTCAGLIVGCGKQGAPGKESAPADAKGPAFLDAKKETPARLEWNREIVSKRGGNIAFRVTSQGPFTVTVIKGESWKALQRKDKTGVKKEDVFLMKDSNDPTYEGKVTLPAGSVYFILDNRSEKKVEFHLQCFESN